MAFLIGCLSVFAVTLVITKSKIMSCKRQYVQERYKASWAGEQRPRVIHTIWHAFWTCSMCCGFYVSLALAPWFYVSGYVFDVLALFGANWLLHCVESSLFEIGKYFEKKIDTPENHV